MTGKDKFIQACNEAIVDIEFLLNKEVIYQYDLHTRDLSRGLCWYIKKKWLSGHPNLLYRGKDIVGYIGRYPISTHLMEPRAELDKALRRRLKLAKSSIKNIDKIIEINRTLKWD